MITGTRVALPACFSKTEEDPPLLLLRPSLLSSIVLFDRLVVLFLSFPDNFLAVQPSLSALFVIWTHTFSTESANGKEGTRKGRFVTGDVRNPSFAWQALRRHHRDRIWPMDAWTRIAIRFYQMLSLSEPWVVFLHHYS